MKDTQEVGFVRRRQVRWSSVLVLGLLLVASDLRPAHSLERWSGVLRVGFTQSCFLGSNRNDVEASLKTFLTTVARQRGYDLQPEVAVFDDTASFEAAIMRGEVHLAILDSLQYVSTDMQDILVPCFIPVPKENTVGRSYLVLTRKGSGLNTLGDLRGRSFAQLETGATSMGQPWLETFLMEKGFGRPSGFFGRREGVSKPSSAVLPVFFGKKDGCLVDREGFELMKELNPQLGTALQVVAQSEPYVNNVICLSKEGWPSAPQRQDMLRALGELHLEPAGQQLLIIFKVGKLVPFQEAYLDPVRTLWKTYARLTGAGKR